MNKENLKEKLLDTIQNYVMDCIRNTDDEVEMVDVKEGVYIEPAADEEKPWYEQGCVVTWKDADGNPYLKKMWTLDAFANDLGDLLTEGISILEDISKEIYDEIFED